MLDRLLRGHFVEMELENVKPVDFKDENNFCNNYGLFENTFIEDKNEKPIITREKIHKCDSCEETFVRKLELKQHIELNHKKVATSKTSKIFRCIQCD